MLVETDQLKKSPSFAAQHIEQPVLECMATARKGSITARTGLDNSMNRGGKMHGSGTKSARFGLERISPWARNWHDLSSKKGTS